MWLRPCSFVLAALTIAAFVIRSGNRLLVMIRLVRFGPHSGRKRPTAVTAGMMMSVPSAGLRGSASHPESDREHQQVH